MHEEDSLSILGLRPDEEKKLKAMGIRTLEQVAIMSKWDLGLGERRGASVIQTARNILLGRHVENVEINADSKPRYVKIYANRTDERFQRVISLVFNVDLYRCEVKRDPEGFTVMEGTGSFEEVLREAEDLRLRVDASKSAMDVEAGIQVSRKEVLSFAKSKGFDHFWKNVFEEIKGNEVMKQGIACSLFSSPYEPVHILVVGNPASAKTMAKDILVQNFSDIVLIGANSTRAGLVVNRVSGDPGALTFSDGKVVVIDELDKIPEQDIEYTYELLSNGRCRVDTGKIHQDIESHFTAIALANPSEQVFVKDRPLMEQIGLPPALLSRFALIVRAEDIGEEDMRDLMLRKMYMSGEIKSLTKLYDYWVKLARQHNSRLRASKASVTTYIDKVLRLVNAFRDTPLRRDARMSDYARRLPMAIARSEFRDVEDEDLELALDIFEASLQGWPSK
jgi:DNA replicative helicase MCM subunit Mcm2 (Cdc46/Mcm family)